jgi:hypothetical protein
MDEKAKQILIYVIKKLDKDSKPPQEGSWKTQVEKEIREGDINSLKKTYTYLKVLMNGQQAVDESVVKILVGKNILAPALINKGWMFWKKLSVTDNEKAMIETATKDWINEKVAKLESLLSDYYKLLDLNLNDRITYLSCILDIISSCKRKFSGDLKAILVKTKSP